MKKSELHETAREFLEIKREIVMTELRKLDAQDELVAADLRIKRLQTRRDEFMDIIAGEVVELLAKK